MAQAGKAFHEVKGLLRRLDRSIDEAREKRLGPDDPPEAASENRGTPPDELTIGRAERPEGERPAVAAPGVVPPGSARKPSQFGRARPLARPGDAPAATPPARPTNSGGSNPTGRWNGPIAPDDTVIG